MKIQTNLRAGKGGASGAGQNSKGGTDNTTPETVDPTPPPVVYTYNGVSRCPGY